MRDKLHDLRLLYLACQVEQTFEGLEKGLSRHLPQQIQDELRVLFEGGPGHASLQDEWERLNDELARAPDAPTFVEVLEAIVDCERVAQSFYLEHAQELSDPRLAGLFRTLAGEEARHAAAAERALALLRSGLSPET